MGASNAFSNDMVDLDLIIASETAMMGKLSGEIVYSNCSFLEQNFFGLVLQIGYPSEGEVFRACGPSLCGRDSASYPSNLSGKEDILY